MTIKEIEIRYADLKQQDASKRLRNACIDIETAGLWNMPEAKDYLDRLFLESHAALDAYKVLVKSDSK